MGDYRLTGGCHCGNIELDITLSEPPGTFHPRQCDCDFCVKYGAAYLSDPDGTLLIRIKAEPDLIRYRQGDSLADFLICRRCGILTGVAYQHDGRIYAAVNRNAIDGPPGLGDPVTASPKLLGSEEKTQRWRELWFADVNLQETAK